MFEIENFLEISKMKKTLDKKRNFSEPGFVNLFPKTSLKYETISSRFPEISLTDQSIIS